MNGKRLQNIFVDGRPVKEWLAAEEEKKRAEQVPEIYNLEVHPPSTKNRMERVIPKIMRARMPILHGAVGRTIFYNDHLIRRLKGTMEKPYETVMENCLDVIFREAPQVPLTNNKLATAVGKKSTDVSAVMSRFMSRSSDIITLEGKRPPRIYRVLKTVTVEEAYSAYLSAGVKAASDKRAAQRKEKEVLSGVAEFTELHADPLTFNIPKEIKITVQVSGCINFLFDFKKEN